MLLYSLALPEAMLLAHDLRYGVAQVQLSPVRLGQGGRLTEHCARCAWAPNRVNPGQGGTQCSR